MGWNGGEDRVEIGYGRTHMATSVEAEPPAEGGPGDAVFHTTDSLHHIRHIVGEVPLWLEEPSHKKEWVEEKAVLIRILGNRVAELIEREDEYNGVHVSEFRLRRGPQITYIPGLPVAPWTARSHSLHRDDVVGGTISSSASKAPARFCLGSTAGAYCLLHSGIQGLDGQ